MVTCQACTKGSRASRMPAGEDPRAPAVGPSLQRDLFRRSMDVEACPSCCHPALEGLLHVESMPSSGTCRADKMSATQIV